MRSSIPEDVRAHVRRPERISRLLFYFGVTNMLLFLIPCAVIVFFLFPVLTSHGVPAAVIWISVAVIAWVGFSLGIKAGKHQIIDALRQENKDL